jgi:hypothetical protein
MKDEERKKSEDIHQGSEEGGDGSSTFPNDFPR